MQLRQLLPAAACAALAISLAAPTKAAPVLFGALNREVEARVQLDGPPQLDRLSDAVDGAFDRTASQSATVQARSASATASQVSFIGTDRLNASGQLQLGLAGALATDAASARSLLQASFEVTDRATVALRANMAGDGLSTFTGRLKLQGADGFLLDTQLTPAQPEAALTDELAPGQYSFLFEPLVSATGTNTAGSAQYSLFLEATTVIPLPPAAFAALAPLALIAWKTAKRHLI